MMIRKTAGTVGTLAHGAVSTAVSVARHPIGSASLAVGFARGVAEAGLDLVRGGNPGVEEPEAAAPSAPVEQTPLTVVPDPRDELPGPDLAAFEPPRPDDLPEPIVIEADDAPANSESGEAFHHEPKPASREAAHGDPGFDFEEADGFVEEIPEELRTE